MTYAQERRLQDREPDPLCLHEDLVNATSHELHGMDTLHRLTSFKRGDLNQNKDDITGTSVREQAWTLANIGNWNHIATKNSGTYVRPYEDRTHNTANEITEIDPLNIPPDPDAYAPVHDDAGNLTSVPSTDGSPNHKFVYDYRNRLIQVKTQADANVAVYRYDGLNRRVMKDLDSGTDILYLYDGWQVVEERELDGQDWEARRQYIYGGTYIDEPLIFDKDTDADGDCTDSGGSTRYFYAQQANFNVLAVLKDNGDGTATLVETVAYDPYGEATVTVQQGQSASGNPYLFQGRNWDAESGLYYARNRMYAPPLGRWLQRDPIGYVDGMSLYEGLRSAPTVALDPFGNYSDWEVDQVRFRHSVDPGTAEAIVRAGGYEQWIEKQNRREDTAPAETHVDCPGGEWYIAGTLTGHNYFVVGHSRMMVRFACKKALNVGHWHHCCNGAEFDQQVYKVPTALGMTGGLNIGPGLGITRMAVIGSVTGKKSAADLGGLSVGGTGGLTVGPIGFGLSGTGSSNAGRAGFNTWGLGISLAGSIGHTEICADFDDLVSEDSPELMRARLSGGKCTKKWVPVQDPQWVDNPIRPFPRLSNEY